MLTIKVMKRLTILITTLFALLAITFLPSLNAECNVCQSNNAACVNSTSFHLCHGNKEPNYDSLYHCQSGFDCTDLTAICVQSNAARPASCGDTAQCGLCSAHRNYLFACTSRNTFRMCYGAAQPQSELGYCPDGYVCDANKDNVCVPTSEATAVTCDISIDNSQTTLAGEQKTDPPTTSIPANDTPIGITAQQVCDVEQRVGVYSIPGDSSCLEYVRCYMQSGVLYGSISQCPTGTYFSGDLFQCTLKKTAYCV